MKPIDPEIQDLILSVKRPCSVTIRIIGFSPHLQVRKMPLPAPFLTYCSIRSKYRITSKGTTSTRDSDLSSFCTLGGMFLLLLVFNAFYQYRESVGNKKSNERYVSLVYYTRFLRNVQPARQFGIKYNP